MALVSDSVRRDICRWTQGLLAAGVGACLPTSPHYFLLDSRKVVQTALANACDGIRAQVFLTSATIVAVSVADCGCSLAAAT